MLSNNFFFDQIFKDWFIGDNHYSDYKRFLPLFDTKRSGHVDYGKSVMNYNFDYSYPIEVDPEETYVEYIKSQVKNLPIENVKLVSSWWVDYPAGSYSIVHTHEQSQRFTVVLFLTDYIHNEELPHAGHLYAMPSSIKYIEWTPDAGDAVILDGRIQHGTYPAINDRKVFVMDFEYDIQTTFYQDQGGTFKK